MPRRKASPVAKKSRHDLSTKPKAIAKKKAVPKKAPKEKKAKLEKPFADGGLSSSAFFGMLRSCLRRKSMFWPSIQKVRKAAQIPYVGPNKRLKYLYVCGNCGQANPSTLCNVHHKIECGTLKCFDDLPGFVERLFCNSDGLILLCNQCHNAMHPKIKDSIK